MKKLKICLFLFMLVIVHCFSQDNEQTKLFTMIYTPGGNWDYSISFDQQLFFVEHSQHLQKLRKEGKIVVGGRYSDKGFMLLRAKDSLEAGTIIEKDPSVTNQVFNVELFEFKTFYEGWVGNKLKN